MMEASYHYKIFDGKVWLYGICDFSNKLNFLKNFLPDLFNIVMRQSDILV